MVAVQGDDHFVCLQVGDHLVLLVHHLEGDVGGDGRGGGEQGGEEGPIKMGAGAVTRTLSNTSDMEDVCQASSQWNFNLKKVVKVFLQVIYKVYLASRFEDHARSIHS